MPYSPWDYSSDDPVWRAPDGSGVLEYCGSEIGMGGPMIGSLLLKTARGSFIYLGSSCGCPVAWSADGRYLAFPVWLHEEGWFQRLGLADFRAMNLGLSSRTLSVLYIQGFSGTRLEVLDSPLTHATQDVGTSPPCPGTSTAPWSVCPGRSRGWTRTCAINSRTATRMPSRPAARNTTRHGTRNAPVTSRSGCGKNGRARATPGRADASGTEGAQVCARDIRCGSCCSSRRSCSWSICCNFVVYGLMLAAINVKGRDAPLTAKDRDRLKDQALGIAVFPLTLLGAVIERLRGR